MNKICQKLVWFVVVFSAAVAGGVTIHRSFATRDVGFGGGASVSVPVDSRVADLGACQRPCGEGAAGTVSTKFVVGEKCSVAELRERFGEENVINVNLPRVKVSYLLANGEKDGAMYKVCVSSEGKVLEVLASVPFETEDENRVKSFVSETKEKLVGIYKDKLVSCGAEKSGVTIEIEPLISFKRINVICSDPAFVKLIERDMKLLHEEEQKRND